MRSLLKKISLIFLKIILGVFVFYLFLCFILIPAGAPWLIRSQAGKLLNHQVSVRSVWFNPFLLRVSFNGFKIKDSEKKDMVGFDKFWVDASFLSLIKKIYRVESIGLEGLNVNVVILPGNRVNLLELMPEEPQPAAGPKAPGTSGAKPEERSANQKGASAPLAPGSLPKMIIDSISLKRGKVTIADQTVTPNFSTSLNDIDISITDFSTDPDTQARVVLVAKLDEKGKISAEALTKPFKLPLELESTFSLNDYALQVLTPYSGKYAARGVKDGKLDLKMDYRIADNKINARHKLLVQRFDFGKKVESKDALPLPFGLVVALLEDPQGRIAISLPVAGDMSKPEFQYFHLLVQVIKNFFLKLVTSPLMSLVSMMGGESGTEELGFVSFDPGQIELTEPAREKLKVIIKALKERPKLSLELNGSYDPEVDWKAIKTSAFENEFKAKRRESAFTDFRLFENMYKIRFGLQEYWRLAKEYTKKGKTEDEFKAEMRRQIIERGQPDKSALEQLALSRAKAVYDLILAAGFDSSRLTVGQTRKTQASLGQIPLEFTLTVFGELPATESGSAKP